MRIAAMQPYFLPYLGYFSLIAATDQFVVFDPVQYIRHGWINRNRILKPGFADCQYIRVPIAKHSRDTLIRDIQVAEQQDWKDKLLAQVRHYRKRAPYFQQAVRILEQCFECESRRISELNVHCLQVVCDAVEVPFEYVWFDDLDPPIEPPQDAGHWALRIAESLKATSYVNPPGGRDIFQPEDFTQRGVELRFLSPSLSEYPQANDHFIAGLSILDVLMFNSLEETRRLIQQDFTITE